MHRAVVIGCASVLFLLMPASCVTRTSTVTHTAGLPKPSAGTPSVVAGQPPLVWVSGEMLVVTATRLRVVEKAGSPITIRRLVAGETRFFSREGTRFVAVPAGEVRGIRAGTPVCVESLLDSGSYLALRVFLGAACGPRT